jgi:hypothetical protein
MIKTCLLVCCLAACNSASNIDPPDPHDWVPEHIDLDATVATIGDAAYGELCNAFENYVRETYASNHLIQLVCTADAIETTSDAVACANQADACLDTLPAPVEAELQMILDQAGCNALAINQNACVAKVKELKACLDALGDEVGTLELGLTCAAFGEPVPDDWWMIPPPDECTTNTTEC